MITHYKILSKPRKSSVYAAYWNFSVKRNDVFYKRILNSNGPWTADPVIKSYKFTNVFRAADRVSQYLIKLQFEANQSAKEQFFKTMLFKLFNKIETYQYLERELPELNAATFSVDEYDQLLSFRMAQGQTVYSAAYIMPSAGSAYGYKLKHSNHLALLNQMLLDKTYEKIAEAGSLEQVYKILLSYPSLGNFLAFQYTIDLNYSSLINFSEMDFVVAGPGAKNGIHKCFDTLGEYSYEDVIKYMADNQEVECNRLGLNTPHLFTRKLHLIDCQNLFCEVDKYLRVTNPELSLASGKVRIKQKYENTNKQAVDYFFPSDWDINSQINELWPQKANENIFS